MTTQNIDWLLNSDPWTEYRTRIDLLDQHQDSSQVTDAYNRMISHPKIKALITELMDWPGQVLNSHKSAGQSYHKLSFISELGIRQSESKVTADDKFVPESEWRAWKEWDFGQKKIPSTWLTFLIYRIRQRLDKGEE